ncbi:redoxin domain-containing protein [Microcoleus sp. T2B6]
MAPLFSLPDAQGNFVSLADFRGRRVVLYFYRYFFANIC